VDFDNGKHMKKALVVQGGWQGHHPAEMADLLARQLRKHDFEVTISDTLDAFCEPGLDEINLIVPIWTMGTITKEQLTRLLEAVNSGVGIAGVHGGMADSFRNETEYQFMVGGQWVAHPGGDGVTYTVHIDGERSPITEGVPDFTVTSEQYYMHLDPAITVLATTRFGKMVMPVAWIKYYGKGRVFYLSLGHTPDVIRQPEALTIITRGMLWAAERNGQQ
jgi:type 1 glutamine amidotransferase